MPSTALIATQLTDRTTRAYTLTVGGVEVLGAFAGAPYLVPIESIDIDESGPGGASGMDFDIWDPSLLVTVEEAEEVRFHDVTNDIALFRGFVQSWSSAGVIGRVIHVKCIGIEAVLDWVVSSVTIPAGTPIADGVASLWYNATGIGVPLNVSWANSTNGTADNPVGDLTASTTPFTYVYTASAVTISAVTLREAIQQLLAVAKVSRASDGTEVDYSDPTYCTVDFRGGLRLWGTSGTGIPGGYANLTVTDATSGTAATILEHETDATGIVRGVWVTGANAAGTGLVPDGSGKPGLIATITSDATTAAARDRAGDAYLADKSIGVRGRLSIERFSPTTEIHAGSKVTITNTAVGLSSQSYTIFSVRKSFQAGGTQTWDVSYGGLQPSAMRLTRRYTRTTRS